MGEQIHPQAFLSPQAVSDQIRMALNAGLPFSMVRIGDGEALAMAQETVLPIKTIQAHRFLRYAGLIPPDLRARDELVASVLRADLVGLPDRWDLPNFSPLVERVMAAYRIQPRNTCNCCINYQLHQNGLLLPLFKGRRVLIIGRRARELASILKRYYQINIAGHISIDTYRQIPATLTACSEYAFDMAFVSAGIPAVTICVKLAARLGKVALDLGHLADRIIEEYL